MDQLHKLQSRVAQLEAALKQNHQSLPSGASNAGRMRGKKMDMGMMKRKDGQMGKGMDMAGKGMRGKDAAGQGMGGKKMGMRMMKGMAGGAGMAGMKDSDAMAGRRMTDDQMKMSGMMGMGSMGRGGPGGAAMSRLRKAAQLPGFPGASHIYHIGATSFFLDHPEHITLSTDQYVALNRLKQKSLLEKTASQRKIDQAEQELWELTGSDEPDADAIEFKVKEIGKLRGAQRLAFIHSVGQAARLLTDEQRQALLGMSEPMADPSGTRASDQRDAGDTDVP